RLAPAGPRRSAARAALRAALPSGAVRRARPQDAHRLERAALVRTSGHETSGRGRPIGPGGRGMTHVLEELERSARRGPREVDRLLAGREFPIVEGRNVTFVF